MADAADRLFLDPGGVSKHLYCSICCGELQMNTGPTHTCISTREYNSPLPSQTLCFLLQMFSMNLCVPRVATPTANRASRHG